jgi:glycosyltransferase involved in cell wall biosynthesis
MHPRKVSGAQPPGTRNGARPPLRLLMLGTVNHPHVEHLALAMKEHGLDVVVGGDHEPSLPASVLPGQGVEVRAAPPAARRTMRGLVSHVRWIRRLLPEVRPDVVHAHWMPGFVFFAALAGAAPLVAMAWGSDVYRANRRQELVNRFAVRRAELVMTDSAALLDRLAELGAPRERTLLVNWGVDLEAFSPGSTGREELRRSLGLGSGPVILSPRSLLPVYNIPTIVEAFAGVGASVPDAQLVVKHMGIDDAELGVLPHRDRVHLVGHVPYRRMVDYYRAADVCVSMASSDSSPRSVWEAMACGCPVVVSDLPWVHELIEPGADALVVPIEAGAVAQAIERVLSEPELAARLRSRGRALVEAHRNREVEMGRLRGTYERLAGRSVSEGAPDPAFGTAT